MDEAETWATISEAARRLKLTPYGVRSRIRRGALRTKRGNDGRVLVALSGEVESEPAGMSEDRGEAEAEIEFWRCATEQVRLEAAVLRAERDAARELVAELRQLLADARRPWWRRWFDQGVSR